MDIANFGRLEFAVLPLDRDFVTAPGSKSLDGAIFPRGRQGGQQADFASVALEKGLGDGRR